MKTQQYKKDASRTIKSIKISRITNLVTTTLICSGPPLWLILRILDNETEKLMSTALLTFPALIYMTFTWGDNDIRVKIGHLILNTLK